MGGENKRELLNKTKLDFYRQIKLYQAELKPTKEIDGFGSSAIVGEKNYPNLKIHNISTEDVSNSFLKTSEIVKKDYSEIVKLKAKNILGSTEQTYVKKFDDRINQEISDIYKAKFEVEFNSKFDKELKFDKVLVNKVSGIVGSKNSLVSLKANSNISTSKQIEKYTQTDIRSKEAVISLYERGVNEHQIINLLALGSFGVTLNKKLVPTKWAITAFDQIIEKYLHSKLVKYNSIEKFEVYYHKDKGNSFVIVLLPDIFLGEVVEAWENVVERDYCDFNNKLDKAEPECAGGYFATKIGIFESLNERKRQAQFVSLRFIKDYELPLGVVFVRECVRLAMKNKVFSCSNLDDVKKFLFEKYNVHYNLFSNSKLLVERKVQKRLKEFF